jgi:hypothetical protein
MAASPINSARTVTDGEHRVEETESEVNSRRCRILDLIAQHPDVMEEFERTYDMFLYVDAWAKKNKAERKPRATKATKTAQEAGPSKAAQEAGPSKAAQEAGPSKAAQEDPTGDVHMDDANMESPQNVAPVAYGVPYAAAVPAALPDAHEVDVDVHNASQDDDMGVAGDTVAGDTSEEDLWNIDPKKPATAVTEVTVATAVTEVTTVTVVSEVAAVAPATAVAPVSEVAPVAPAIAVAPVAPATAVAPANVTTAADDDDFPDE